MDDLTSSPATASSADAGAEEISNRKAALELQRLEYDVLRLERELSPQRRRLERLDIITKFAGIVTTAVAIGTLTWSIVRSTNETAESNRIRSEARLDTALSGLASPNVSERIVSASVLTLFLNSEFQERLGGIFQTIASTLWVEDNAFVRTAILRAVADFNVSNVARSNLDTTLLPLAAVSRELAKDEAVIQYAFADPEREKPGPPQVEKAKSIAQAIEIILKKGARQKDLSGVYCQGCNLDGLNLEGVRLDSALLQHASFRRSLLSDASMNEAALEGAIFTEATLRRASFISPEPLLYPPSPNPLFRTLSSNRYFDDTDFSCADLREANFSGFVALPIYDDGSKLRGLPSAKFRKANLAGTRMQNLKLYWVGFGFRITFDGFPITMNVGAVPWEYLTSISLPPGPRKPVPEDSYVYGLGILTPGTSRMPKGAHHYTEAFEDIAWSFGGSNWREGQHSPLMTDILQSTRDPGDQSDKCTPAASSQ